MYGSLGEAIVRETLKEYFPEYHVIKTRALPWLKPLELDCYIPELKLAFEYQGAQHYEYIPYFHENSYEKFVAQQARDQRKRDGAKGAKVTLIEVPYTVPHSYLRVHVRQELIRLGHPPSAHPMLSDVFYAKVATEGKLAVAMLDKAHAIAESHGGICLSETYLNCHDPLLFVCREGHEFETPLASVNHVEHTRPRFCPDCGGTRRRTFEENKALVDPSGYTLLDLVERRIGIGKATVHGKQTIYLRVRCPSGGHEYLAQRNNFLPLKDGKPNRGCIRCARKEWNHKRGAKERAERAARFGLEQLSPFSNRHDAATWRCGAKGHEFVASWNTVLARKGKKCLECP